MHRHITNRIVIHERVQEKVKNGCKYVHGQFVSPLASHCPHLFVEENMKLCRWKGMFVCDERKRKGVVINLAATGDHSYKVREFSFANDLLQRGIGSVLIENPFYGSRKPSSWPISFLAFHVLKRLLLRLFRSVSIVTRQRLRPVRARRRARYGERHAHGVAARARRRTTRPRGHVDG